MGQPITRETAKRFVSLTQNDAPKKAASVQVFATVNSIDSSDPEHPIYYVDFDGATGQEPSPVYSTLGEAVLNVGDRVIVILSNRAGTIIGNITTPADEGIVEEMTIQMHGIYEFINAAESGSSTVINGGSIKTGTLNASQIKVGNVSLDVDLDNMNDNIDGAYEYAEGAYEAVDDAKKTATNYLTTISGRTGICVHNANDTKNYCNINSSGLGVYTNNTLTASFSANQASFCNGQAFVGVNSSDSTIALKSTQNVTLSVAHEPSSLRYWSYLEFTGSLISLILHDTKQSGDVGITIRPTYITVRTSSFELNGSITASGGITSNGSITGNKVFANSPADVSGKPNVRWATNTGQFGLATDTDSSKRFKHDIKLLENDELNPDKLYEIPVIQFKYNDDHIAKNSQYKGKDIIGLIAEDVEKIYPIATWYDEEGRVEDWNEKLIIAGMLKLIQDQHKEIEALKERLDHNGL